MTKEVASERVSSVIAEEVREARHGLGLLGQAVGLLVRDHLQAMFDAPQELISRAQFVARLRGDPVARRQHLERLQRLSHPQFGMPAARDQLLRLGKELDLADPAAPDLDIVAFDRDLALPAIGLHLPLHVMDIGERGEVEMLAPDEGREFGDQRLAGLQVAGAWPRLDHGGALPGAPFPLVIMQCRRRRHRHLCGRRIRPQPQVDAKHVTVPGSLLQQPRHGLRDPHEKRLRFDVRCQRHRLGLEKHDQVDVAGKVEFAGAHLAHGEHEQPAVLLWTVRIGREQTAARRFLPKRMVKRHPDRGNRKLRQRRRHPHHRPDAADVAERDEERRFRLHAAERVHHLGLSVRGENVARGGLQQ